MDPQLQQIAQTLSQRGWIITDGPSVATKRFMTVVGEKTAIAWFSRRADQVGNRSLTGEYHSEGSNILAARGQIIHEGDDARRVEAAVMAFADSAEAAIADSYAVRLLR